MIVCMTMLRCSHCKIALASSEFTNSQQRRGNSRWCRPCVKENNRLYNLKRPARPRSSMTPEQVEARRQLDRLKDPRKVADRWFRYRYGLTVDQVDKMIEQQDGLCAICREPETKTDPRTRQPRRLSVDHDHRTGLPRRMLCQRCNWVLSHVDDDIEMLKQFIDYLEAFTSRE